MFYLLPCMGVSNCWRPLALSRSSIADEGVGAVVGRAMMRPTHP
jgi:hypothetical protein